MAHNVVSLHYRAFWEGWPGYLLFLQGLADPIRRIIATPERPTSLDSAIALASQLDLQILTLHGCVITDHTSSPRLLTPAPSIQCVSPVSVLWEALPSSTFVWREAPSTYVPGASPFPVPRGVLPSPASVSRGALPKSVPRGAQPMPASEHSI